MRIEMDISLKRILLPISIAAGIILAISLYIYWETNQKPESLLRSGPEGVITDSSRNSESEQQGVLPSTNVIVTGTFFTYSPDVVLGGVCFTPNEATKNRIPHSDENFYFCMNDEHIELQFGIFSVLGSIQCTKISGTATIEIRNYHGGTNTFNTADLVKIIEKSEIQTEAIREENCRTR